HAGRLDGHQAAVRGRPRVAPQAAARVHHLRPLEQRLRDGQGTLRVARQQDALGDIGRGVQVDGIRRGHGALTIWDTATRMAKGRPTPQRIPDAVRDAVERTIAATVGSAQQTRARTQEAMDDLVERAEASAEQVRQRVRGAIDTTRPATYEELRELQAELRALARRLDAIEERLPAKRA